MRTDPYAADSTTERLVMPQKPKVVLIPQPMAFQSIRRNWSNPRFLDLDDLQAKGWAGYIINPSDEEEKEEAPSTVGGF